MDINTQHRVHFLDSLRGITIIHMVLFHFCYDLVFFVGINISWYTQWPGNLWGTYIRWSFILISGMVFFMGRHPVKRGMILLGWGCVLTLATWAAVPEAMVRFGILSFLGTASLLGALLYPWLKRMPAQWGMLCSAVLLAVCWTVPQGGLGTGRHILMKIPESFYDTSFLYWLGFPSEDFYSSDYFPVFPWIFLFFFGVFLGEFLRYKGVFEWMSRKRPGTLAFLGRHSLCIYLLHQPVLYGVCIVLNWLY
ncbi:MAG: DUF1624 domain-containing protein [Lachnospiraceae bacterium]|nr:DUF1624 domain-containing protein [Lachnospiraceae bacterium]